MASDPSAAKPASNSSNSTVNSLGGLLVGCIVASFIDTFDSSIQQIMQGGHAPRTQTLIQGRLRRLPGTMPLGSLRFTGLGRFDETAARIASRSDLQPSTSLQRPHAARQSRSVHLHSFG
ncbi:hypothetical protein D3C71_1775770 [compost metagenome]